MVNTVMLLVFPVLMAFAASSDLLTMRISNRLVLILTGAFVVVALMLNLSFPEVAMSFAAAAIVLAVAFTFFAFGWIGGGDAKLAAATALWMGFGLTLPYLLYAAVLGGTLTLIFLALRRFPLPPQLMRYEWIERLHNSRNGVPYGIALAAAGMMTYVHTPVFERLIA